MFLSVATLMLLAYGDLSRPFEWVCVHITRQRLITTLSQKKQDRLFITEVMLTRLVVIQ